MTADLVDTAIFQATSYLDVHQGERAIAILRDALAREPGDHRLLGALAHTLYETGDDGEAETCALASLESHRSTSALITLGNIANQRGDHESALRYAGEVATMAPDSPAGHQLAAVALTHRATIDPAAVRDAYRRALLSSRDPETLKTAAFCELRLRHPVEAKALAAEGLELAPHDEYLNRLHTETEPSKRRNRRLLELLQLNPQDSWARSMLVGSVTSARTTARTASAVAGTSAAIVLAFAGWFAWVLAALIVALGLAVSVPGMRALRTVPRALLAREWPRRERWLLAVAPTARVIALGLLVAHQFVAVILLVVAALLDAVPASARRLASIRDVDADQRPLLAHTADTNAFSLFLIAAFLTAFSHLTAGAGATSGALAAAAASTWVYCLGAGAAALDVNRRLRRWGTVILGVALTAAALVALATDTVRGVDELSSDHRSQHASWKTSSDGDAEGPYRRCGRRAICPNPDYTPPTFATPSFNVPEVEIPSFTPPSIEIPDVTP